MQLATNIWLQNGFYIDIDHLEQFRVVGPGDHFYFGMINEKNKLRNYEISDIFPKGDDVIVFGHFFGPKAKFFYPVMGDIRTLRTYMYEKSRKIRTLFEIRKNFPDVLLPEKIKESETDRTKSIKFERHFGKNFYGSELILEKDTKISKGKSLFLFSSEKPTINFTLRIYSSGFFKQEIFGDIFLKEKIDFKRFGSKSEEVRKISERAKTEVDHLLKYKKTSSFDYGTIFPRDWTETAILGFDDFNKKALKYIIQESLRYVDEKGEGWHEAGVGEYAYNRNVKRLPLVMREMIDIEPRYILTFGAFPEIFKDDEVLLRKIRRVASFVLGKAKKYSLIRCEEVNFQCGEVKDGEKPKPFRFKAGNWRDSISAYLNVASSCIIPYDVNAVFYPASLKIIHHYKDLLDIGDKDLEDVVSKWQKKKELFRFKNKNGFSGYSLALYDFKNEKEYKKLAVNHTDEAYDLIFGSPSEEDVKSFASRILDEDYFNTRSGPLIVGKNQGYNSLQYHGEVIWLKQIGLCSLGFRRQLERKDFSKETKELLREAVKYLFDSLIYSFDYLNLLPELFIDKKGAPMLYNDQESVEGHMNKIQLWSAEASRRVILDYYDVFKR